MIQKRNRCNTPTTSESTAKQRQKTALKRHGEAHGKSTHRNTSKMFKMSLLVRACVRVLSCKGATPLLKSTLIFPLFTIARRCSPCLRVRCVRVYVRA